MKFTLAALVAGLLATPGTGQHIPSFAVSQVACNELDTFMLSVTNNTCSIKLQNAPEVCTPFIEKFAINSPRIVAEMQKLEEACKEEMMQTKSVAVLKNLKSEHEKMVVIAKK